MHPVLPSSLERLPMPVLRLHCLVKLHLQVLRLPVQRQRPRLHSLVRRPVEATVPDLLEVKTQNQMKLGVMATDLLVVLERKTRTPLLEEVTTVLDLSGHTGKRKVNRMPLNPEVGTMVEQVVSRMEVTKTDSSRKKMSLRPPVLMVADSGPKKTTSVVSTQRVMAPALDLARTVMGNYFTPIL